MRVNQTLTYSKADKYFNDLKNTYIKTEADKGKAIDILFSDDTIELEVQEVVIQRILNYDVTGNNEVAAPVVAIPAPAPTPITTTTSTEIAAEDNVRAPIPARFDTLIEPVSTSTDEKFSAEVKVRLYNGEDKDDLINFVLNYLTTNEEVKSELIDYICEYSHATALAGQIGSDIQF